uniref:Leucine-rich repeat-containing N-terminal plant-type domain-containing protein n=2 Tax=Aegilops tauschii subsp. strangulata TaxID=200361 RepID=A0A453FGQ7_AEGTS
RGFPRRPERKPFFARCSLCPWPVTSRQSPHRALAPSASPTRPSPAALKPRKNHTHQTHSPGTDTTMPASIAVFLCLLSVANAAAMDPAERETLFLVMDAVSSDRDWRSESPDPCGAPWPGLECKPAPGTAAPLHVTRLDFGVEPNPSCKDAATFPPQVLTLPRLQSLFFVDCFNNPAAVTALVLPSANLSSSTLQQLSIRANPSLSGVMPPQLVRLRSLQVLTISQNGLVRGEIPQGIGELKSLVHLDLSYNSLSGPVPSRISELKGLVGLDLSYNALSGPIPSRIGDLNQLQKLDLSSNNLTGGIPDTVANLTSLTFLALSNNGLNGHFPPDLSGLRNLQYLIMDNNPMDVPLPSELGSLARLQELRLAGSGYSGPIPAAFGQLASLTTLSLEDNNLTGEIPAGLSRLHRIYHLNLSNNGLGGAVPFDGAFLRRLGRNLDLSGNSGLCLDVVRDVGVGVGACHGGGGGDGSLARDSVSSAARGVMARGSTDSFRFRLLGPVCVVVICIFLSSE